MGPDDVPRLLDVVTLLRARRGVELESGGVGTLEVGAVGTVVEVYASPPGYEVEFLEPDGRTRAVLAFEPNELEIAARGPATSD